jgi:hypothetical protein
MDDTMEDLCNDVEIVCEETVGDADSIQVQRQVLKRLKESSYPLPVCTAKNLMVITLQT